MWPVTNSAVAVDARALWSIADISAAVASVGSPAAKPARATWSWVTR
jgi:hypothetical protein